jgi:hypothetical protein
MVSVSDRFRLERGQGELDFVDVNVDGDTRLFVDPRALRLIPTPWGEWCVSLIQDFFRTVLEAIRDDRMDDAWTLLAGLREPNETHLGMSQGKARGSALGPQLAAAIRDSLAETDAAISGRLEDLEETALLVPLVDRDRVSDIATNLIREPLIQYTQLAAEHYGIELSADIDSGPLWDPGSKSWTAVFTELPVVKSGKLLLVPKAIVRRHLDYRADEYRDHYLLTLIQEEEVAAGGELVRTLMSGEVRPPYKKTLKEMFGTNKPAIARLTREHPDALDRYRAAKRQKITPPMSHEDFFLEGLGDPPELDSLLAKVRALAPGREDADGYHKAIEAFLTALFYPSLTLPQIEYPIHRGRKRIDIAYANVAQRGFFGWIGNHYPSAQIFVECKNVSEDPANPELDQLAGRFSPRRGKVGLLVCRGIEDKALMTARCRDASDDDRGYIIALDDDDLETLARQLQEEKRLGLLRERFEALIA